MPKKKSTTIISWNINGMRALVKNEGYQEIMQHDADIYCFQESKVTEEQLPDIVRETEGYYIYVYPSAERKGHAGTMLMSKSEAKDVLYGLPNIPRDFPNQGRTITAVFDDVTVVNCYFPNGGSATSNLEYKLQFFEYFLSYINDLHAQGQRVIVAGDVNIAHTPIDLARPKENEKNTGFLPEERAWVDRYIEEGWTDLWRSQNPDRIEEYTWWSYRAVARPRNIGWRIDYFLMHQAYMKSLKRVEHMTDVMGSDHCPLLLEIK